MLKWGQTILEWKKINPLKVSDSFQLYRQLMNVILEEFERFCWDFYVNRMADHIRQVILKEDDTRAAMVKMSDGYNCFY